MVNFDEIYLRSSFLEEFAGKKVRLIIKKGFSREGYYFRCDLLWLYHSYALRGIYRWG